MARNTMTEAGIDAARARRLARVAREVHTPPKAKPKAVNLPPSPTYRDRRAWAAKIGRPCARHHAVAGQPCWAAPTRALCGAR